MASPDRNTPRANLGTQQKYAQIKPGTPASRPATTTRHHCLPQRPVNNGSGLKYLLYPTLVLGLLWLGAQHLPVNTQRRLAQPQRQVQIEPIRESEQPVAPQVIAGGVKLQRDRSGYFRGTVLINDVPMPFLIDTGATHTTIPMGLAGMAHLPPGSSILTQTAGGQVNSQLTRAESMKIGNAELRNIDVITNQHLEEVLIGMNTLKHFRMTQTENTLTLVANSDPAQADEIERNLSTTQPPKVTASDTEEQTDYKAPTSWKKSTVCDDTGKRCKTVYGH